MKTAMSNVRTDAAGPRYYWTLNRTAPFASPDVLEEWGCPETPKDPHGGLCDGQFRTAKELMKHLIPRGWSVRQLKTSERAMFARVEVTPEGFNVVNFPSYAAACADDSRREAAAKASRPIRRTEQRYSNLTDQLVGLAEKIVLGAELQNEAFRRLVNVQESLEETYLACFYAVRLRLSLAPENEESKPLWWALQIPKYEFLTKAARNRLVERVARICLNDGDSQEILLKEVERMKREINPPRLTGKPAGWRARASARLGDHQAAM